MANRPQVDYSDGRYFFDYDSPPPPLHWRPIFALARWLDRITQHQLKKWDEKNYEELKNMDTHGGTANDRYTRCGRPTHGEKISYLRAEVPCPKCLEVIKKANDNNSFMTG